MTTPDHKPPASQPPVPTVKDRIYRSPMGLAGGVLLLAVVAWLGFDALFKGHGRTPWLALATMILVIPPVIAFTLRPAVFANEDRLRIRNPYRVITVPWGEVEGLRSSFTNEVRTKSGTTYQLWAVPVSLRARKKAERRAAGAARRSAGEAGFGGRGLGFGGLTARGAESIGPTRAEGDKVMDDLRELLDQRGNAESAQGRTTIRWAYEVAAPTLAGAVLLVILLVTGG
ncbi:PH domain-containing protein [Streptomyces sp. NPDC048106]|uniref:PH domain-containing protein n=1 Tax=Streptomyces sp. NPDC048106 TaxID=3155750 RepID=UPI00345125EF